MFATRTHIRVTASLSVRTRTASCLLAILSGFCSPLALAADPDGDGLDSAVERTLLNSFPFSTEQVISLQADGAKVVAIADMDGDTIPDVISASNGDKKIAWYKNSGGANPTFGAQQIIAITAGALQSIAVGDIDADGDMDVLSGYAGAVAWYQNNGNPVPGFSSAMPVYGAVGFSPTAVAIADVNADGSVDVLSTSADNKLAWYQGSGGAAPTFGAQQVLSLLGDLNLPLHVMAVDIDQDTDTDIFTASLSDNKLAWYRSTFKNSGQKKIQPQVTISTAAQGPVHMAAADVNGDGHIDVLLASSADGRISWFQNPGGTNPTFGALQQIALASGATSVAASDFDGDGDVDVVAANGNNITWFRNPGGPAPVNWPATVISGNALGAYDVAVGDLNGDGAPDIVSASSTDDKIAWYRNPASDPNVYDTDGDGLNDGLEYNTYGTSPTSSDTDNDGLSDGDEINIYFTDPTLTDSDGDGLSDGDEINIHSTDPADPDSDNDNLSDGDEVAAGTDPLDSDTDNDGLLDGFEVTYGLNPLVGGEQNADPDGDGLDNLAEQTHGTDPFNADTDGDSLSDSDELLAGTDPTDSDTDGDGLHDAFELTYGFNPLVGGEQNADPDGDGLDNLAEQAAGSNPGLADTDGDTLSDGAEVNTYGTNPNRADTDADGLADNNELTAGTNPRRADTDGDGLRDGFEVTYGYNPLNGTLGEETLDPDGEGLLNLLEQSAGTDPFVADTDADGLTDSAELLRVRTHAFESRQTISTTAASARAIVTGDLDGDGDLDAIAVSANNDTLAWYENRLAETSGDFGPARIISAALNNTNVVAVADMDGDGDPDVIANTSEIDGRVVWFQNRLDEVTGDFLEMPVLIDTVDYVESIVPADMDGDHDPDIVIGYGTTVAWLRNQGGGSFAAEQVVTTLSNGLVAVGDLDGDGDNDVLSGDDVNSWATWFESSGGVNPVFAAGQTVGEEDQITIDPLVVDAVAIADLNGDGAMDVIAAGNLDDYVVWYQNNAAVDPAFGLEKDINPGGANGARFVSAADLDSDGDLDVLSASENDDKVAWYENRLNEVSADFSPEKVITTQANGALWVHVADLDQDGAPDVLTASRLDDTLAWHRNPATNPTLADTDGDGLDDGDELAAGTDPFATDTDGDGLLDGFEVTYGLNPLVGGEQNLDTDGDGLNSLAEQAAGTDPGNPDTDGDGVNDGDEIANGTDPLVPNSVAGDLAPYGAPDGVLNAADLVVMQRMLSGQLVPTAGELAAGDLNHSGVLDSGDLVLLTRAVNGLVTLP